MRNTAVSYFEHWLGRITKTWENVISPRLFMNGFEEFANSATSGASPGSKDVQDRMVQVDDLMMTHQGHSYIICNFMDESR
jgi:aryl-phospho-beta-D-glucosidase BglC (GH1 family)